MSISIHIPTPLRKFTNEEAVVSLDGVSTVGEALGQLGASHPELQARLFKEDGSIRRFVNVFANEEDIRFLDQMDTQLEDGDELSIIPAIAGG